MTLRTFKGNETWKTLLEGSFVSITFGPTLTITTIGFNTPLAVGVTYKFK